jgi:restriction system protein
MGILDKIIKKALEQGIEAALKAQEKAIKTETEPSPERPTEWNLNVLMSLEWKRFEEVCKEWLVMRNLNAELTQIGADGGVDIKIYEKEKVVCLVQCKAWAATSKINVKEVRELYGIMASEQVNNGVYITTSSYTQDAIAFSNEKQIKLFDGKELIEKIKKLPPDKQKQLLDFATNGDYKTPTCARCNVKMTKRNSKNGYFWGCKNYPRCRSTIQIRKIQSK